MRLLRGHPEMAGALADAGIPKSQALAIAKWTKKLPAELRAETIKILVQAAQAGASLDDLRMIAAVALEKWRASRPDADEDGFDDRYVQVGTTFGGAGVIRGNLTPECAAAVQAVLEALGKKAARAPSRRHHDGVRTGRAGPAQPLTADHAGGVSPEAAQPPVPLHRQRRRAVTTQARELNQTPSSLRCAASAIRSRPSACSAEVGSSRFSTSPVHAKLRTQSMAASTSGP